MPGRAVPANSTDLPQLDLRCIRRAVETGGADSSDAHEIVAALPAWREKLANPLTSLEPSTPDPSLRARLVERPEVTVTVASGQPPIRLAADAVSVAVALSDELYINELDAARLLADARPLLYRRPDNDVVEAAKELFYSRRRESLMFLQEILRVHLLKPACPDDVAADDFAFRDALVRERDALLVEHNLFLNIVARLTKGIPSLRCQASLNSRPSSANSMDYLVNDEAVLLAECVFLLSYSVQVSSQEALAVRELLEKIVPLVSTISKEEQNAARAASRWHHAQVSTHSLTSHVQYSTTSSGQARSEVLVRAESVQNILFASWLCCVDRSRYSDIYNPRTAESGVNALLKDDAFIRRTSCLPPYDESSVESVETSLSPVMAAAELGGALFRLATAAPDVDEILLTVLRVCGYADALEFLSQDFAAWIDTGAGSMLPDSLLYADVLEDFAFDLSEAPDVSNLLFRCTQDELQNSTILNVPLGAAGEQNSLAGSTGNPLLASVPSSSRRSLSLSGKPPKPPSSVRGIGQSVRTGPLPGGETSSKPARVPHIVTGEGARIAKPSNFLSKEKPKNLVALLGNLIARAITLVPNKLLCNSICGGSRYWVGVGPETSGFIPRVGDAVLDMWDAAYRQVDNDSIYATAFLDALGALLNILFATAVPGGSVTHAASSLQFLCESGHPVVSIDRASQALTHFHEALSANSAQNGVEIGEAEAVALGGVWKIVARCAKSLQAHGGIEPILGRAGSDLGMRVTSLALHDVSSRLRAALVFTICALGDRRAIQLFMDEAVKNKAALLRQMIRGEEADLGFYDSTICVLELATECCQWNLDDFPSYAVESIAVFAVDEVVAHWSHRKYSSEGERWRLMKKATELLLAVVRKDQEDGDGFVLAHSVFAKFISPAPGTGAAGLALRAILAAAGLRRSIEDCESTVLAIRSSQSASSEALNSWPRDDFQFLGGRDALARAASVGDGTAFKEMEAVSISCSRIITFILSLSPSHFSSSSVVISRASELIVGEQTSLRAVASMVYAADDLCSKPSYFRTGYNEDVCRTVLAMLSVAASQSSLVCNILTRIDESDAALRFRCALAELIASYDGMSFLGLEEDVKDELVEIESMEEDDLISGERRRDDEEKNFSRLHLALHLVEACLGLDGSGRPGCFLLGLAGNALDHPEAYEFGVLVALMELVLGVNYQGTNRIDNPLRSTAAAFLERLAVNTTQKTSRQVVNFIRDFGMQSGFGRLSPTDADVARGFGDEILCGILEFYCNEDRGHSLQVLDVDWASLGEFAGSCMTLSALFVRQFRDDEAALLAHQKSSFGFSSATPLGHAGAYAESVIGHPLGRVSSFPSPNSLLRLVASVAANGKISMAFDMFRKLHYLLDARLSSHPGGKGYCSIALLMELCMTLLDSLESLDSSNDLATLASQDGGVETSSVALLCLDHISRIVNSEHVGSDDLGESQSGLLLGRVVQALARTAEGRGNNLQTRTSLYAAFLICSQIASMKASEELISQAFAGPVGLRQSSGAEALVSIACRDASSGAPAATRATALVSLSTAVQLDPLRILRALSSQNRLRRVIAAVLADPYSQNKLADVCRRRGDWTTSVQDRAVVIIAESAVSLIHAIAQAPDGVRVLADAACLESVISMLHRVVSAIPTFPHNNDLKIEMSGQSFSRESTAEEIDSDSYRDDAISNLRYLDEDDGHGCAAPASVVCLLTSAVAASVMSSNSMLVDGALSCLRVGKNYFSRMIRSLDRPCKTTLSILSHVAMILHRLPQHILSASAGPVYLRSLFACYVGNFAPPARTGHVLGQTNSPFSSGVVNFMPRSDSERKRFMLKHPEGGTLFERDLIAARTEALSHAIAALRSSSSFTLFSPRFISDQPRGVVPKDDSIFVDEVTGRQGDLGDIVRIAKAALFELRRNADEHSRLSSLLGDNPRSIPSSRILDMADFLAEELHNHSGDITSEAAWHCLRSTANTARLQADKCVTMLESSLFILREYTHIASNVVKGSYRDIEGQQSMSMLPDVARDMLETAHSHLLPICTEVDDVPSMIWGQRDPSFCRQISRQIRTNVTTVRL